ncbi:hypothetical protein TNCV_221971 [Trichonephila clavipes]|nr:hypothetical protein TNCV_221971 [Trichonephila clavipes]
MGHEDELTTEKRQEILNEEHQETQRSVSPSEQEEDERGPMPTSAIKGSRKASTKVFKKRRGVFNKGRCNKSNDGCGESNSTVPKNSADEKNCADGAKLCTNETKPSASERKNCKHGYFIFG